MCLLPSQNGGIVAIMLEVFISVLDLMTYKGKILKMERINDFDTITFNEIASIKKNVEESLEAFRFREALKEAMNLARLGK